MLDRYKVLVDEWDTLLSSVSDATFISYAKSETLQQRDQIEYQIIHEDTSVLSFLQKYF